MKKITTKVLAAGIVLALSATMFAACAPKPATSTPAPGGTTSTPEAPKEPIKISLAYSDNPTLPFKADWPVITEIQKRTNTELKFEVIPSNDFQTKVSLMLNSGKNTTDVVLWQDTKGENASLAMNGAVVPISDYSEWTPHFNKFVEDNKMTEDIDALRLKDDKYYFIPTLYDQAFYDGGLILREDYLKTKGFEAPKTFDDLYKIMKAYKEENPSSYPMTILAAPRVLYRMTMPSFGISLSRNAASGSHVLSYDYEKGTYFPGAISDEYKAYLEMISKWYAEGLVDPEMAEPIDGDKWTTKMATGASIASYAYYDQIGGIEGNSTIEGIKFNMYPPLEGPKGAHHQPKSRTDKGILFPAETAKRADFEQVVRAIDEIFYEPENAKLWCLAVEGDAYKMEGDKIVFNEAMVNSKDGLYKAMQLAYGCGANGTQMVWINEREMTKYDENYAAINKTVAAMDDAIQGIPPTPMFDDIQSEEANIIKAPLADAFDKWINDFFTGKKSVAKDWDAYVTEMKNLKIEDLNKMYNDNMK